MTAAITRQRDIADEISELEIIIGGYEEMERAGKITERNRDVRLPRLKGARDRLVEYAKAKAEGKI